MRFLHRLIILSHRYLGIAIGSIVILWFASGIAMIYARDMPRLDAQTRLERLPALDFSRVSLSPFDAEQRAGAAGFFGRPTLTTVLERPAYRYGGPYPTTIFADDGSELAPIDVDEARGVAARFLETDAARLEFLSEVKEPDQWTLAIRRSGAPLYKFRLDDAERSEVYVSAATAEVALWTTRSQRTLAWLGAIPHWLYFTALRTNQPLWFRVIVWLSSLACVLSVLGLILAFTQFRRTKPFRWSLAVPYRGWMRWHYICGAIFGVFTLTWAFSGLLSVEPFGWTNAEELEIDREVLSGGPVDLESLGAIDGAALSAALGGRTIKEVGFARIHDEHYLTVATSDLGEGSRAGHERLVHAGSYEARTQLFPSAQILERVITALPANVRIAEHAVLDDYDAYYYSRDGRAPLPVLRIKLNDPARTWVYIDLATSRFVGSAHRYSRLERWLYRGLHSLDFKFWYDKRPLWDMGMIVLLLGGLATSSLGFYLGVKRLIRDLRPKRT